LYIVIVSSHQAMLQNMANKRKAEEEELQLLVQQQQDKRKKFRDVSSIDVLLLYAT
jgi:hypothetical protein